MTLLSRQSEELHQLSPAPGLSEDGSDPTESSSTSRTDSPKTVWTTRSDLVNSHTETTPRPQHNKDSVVYATIFDKRGRVHQLEYAERTDTLTFTLQSAGDDDGKPTPRILHRVIYRLSELLAVRDSPIAMGHGMPKARKLQKKASGSGSNASVGDTATTLQILYFYFVHKKDRFRWRLKEIAAEFESVADKDYFRDVIQAKIRGMELRPRRLLVFINPFGGKRRAPEIYANHVEMFFELAGIDTEVVLTDRANHAFEHLIGMPDSEWRALEGVVSVGGDGLFNELLSAVLVRTEREAGLEIADPNVDGLVTPRIRLGIIGAGSANSIVSTVHETDDYATAAIHIAIGSDCCVDVASVHKGEDVLMRLSANSISYGWLGDVLRDSENYRCMGPLRYQWSALRTTVRHPIYRGLVEFELTDATAQRPATLPPCLEGCPVCERGQPTHYQFHWYTDYTHIICCVNPCVSPFTPLGLAPYAQIGDGSMDLALLPRISRVGNFLFMLKAAKLGGKQLMRNNPSLSIFRVTRWAFSPTGSEPGVWNLDGEVLDQPRDQELRVRLHGRLIRYFGRDPTQQINITRRHLLKKQKSTIVYT